MKIARFAYKKDIYWGEIREDYVSPLRGAPFGKITFLKQRIPLNKIKLLSPATPTKIVLIGLNYKDHAKELKMKTSKEPLIFLKPNTCLIGDGERIVYPKGVKRLDYEAELAIVIGKKAKNVKVSNASKHILGFTCLNDVTARDLQKKDIQWTRAKSFDTFCPLGPWIETKLDTSDLKISLYLNGRLKQSSSTQNFIFKIDYLVSFISHIMTLLPGDVISTGTPHGVGPMKKGDIVEVEVEGLGRLKNQVI